MIHQVQDLLSSATRPHQFSQRFETLPVDRLPAFVQRVFDYPGEINGILAPFLQIPVQCQHGPVFVGEGGFQRWNTVAKPMNFVLRPNRVGERCLDIRPVGVGDVDYRLLFSRNEKPSHSVKLPRLQLWVECLDGVDRPTVIAASLDKDVHIVGRSRPPGPAADGVGARQNKRNLFLTEST